MSLRFVEGSASIETSGKYFYSHIVGDFKFWVGGQTVFGHIPPPFTCNKKNQKQHRKIVNANLVQFNKCSTLNHVRISLFIQGQWVIE